MTKHNHSTMAETMAALRPKFREMRGRQAAKTARWILQRADPLIRNMFGVTPANLPALKARLQDKADRLTTLEAQEGE